MKPVRFDYARPDTLADALALIADNPDAAVLSGGQSLMPMLAFRMSRPAMLIDINRIPALDTIELADDVLRIGARARHNDVLRSAEVARAAPLLVKALPFVAHEAIRNRGTFGGSLALADPAAELPACAVCLGAEIIIASRQGGTRSVPAGSFFTGIYETALEPGEMIVRIDVPVLGKDWRFTFDEVARRRGDFAMAGLALAVRLDGRRIAESRIALCGVEAAPRRIGEAESALGGADIDDAQARRSACAALAGALEPMDSAELPASYRVTLSEVLLRRVLRQIAEP